MKDDYSEIDRFLLAVKERNTVIGYRQWVSTNYVSIYMRAGYRFVKGQTIRTIDIATIQVFSDQGRGHGRAAIEYIHEHNPRTHTYIECVSNEKLEDYLIKSGWMLHNYNNYYKIVSRVDSDSPAVLG